MKYHHPSLTLLMALLLLAAMPGCETTEHSADAEATAYETLPPGVGWHDADQARVMNEQAVQQIEAGAWDDAEQLLKEALTADKTFGPAHNNLGKVYHETGRLYLAAWEFDYAIKLMPHQFEPRNNLGLVLEEARRLDEAVEQYERARQDAPDSAELLGNLTRARLKRGDDGDAVRDLLGELILKDTRPRWLEWARREHSRVGTE